MACYWYKRDENPTIKVAEVGSYDFLTGEKSDKRQIGIENWPPRFRVTIEYDFGPCEQMDGHGPSHGDWSRGFAELILETLKDSLNKEEFVRLCKEICLDR